MSDTEVLDLLRQALFDSRSDFWEILARIKREWKQ